MNELTVSELQRLRACEMIIEKGQETFISVGSALLEIREAKLYRQTHKTFEDYCRERWKINRNYANKIIRAAEVVKLLGTNGTQKPTSERQVRPLTNLPPEKQKEAWAEATKTTPQPTEKQVKEAVTKVTSGSVESRDSRIARHRKRVAKNGVPELLKALDEGLIGYARAETIADWPRDTQLAGLRKELSKSKNGSVAPAESPEVKSTPVAKPAEKVPAHLTRGIITEDQVAKGYAVYSDVAGRPCSLAPDVSELEHKERAASMIGGSWKDKDMIAYEKWEKFADEKIAERVLKVLERMSPLEIPAHHHGPGFTKLYDLTKSADLRELATMLSAHLLRLADAAELREKYGHLYV